MVAKSNIKQEILHINMEYHKLLVKGKKGSYTAKIHKDLFEVMDFVEKGDCAYIKWKQGQAWIVGFQKKKAHENELQTPNEEYWRNFLRGVEVE